MRHSNTCHAGTSVVIDTTFIQGRVKRKRRCHGCLEKFETWEVMEADFERMKEADAIVSEINERRWAVVDSSGVTATDLTHGEALSIVRRRMVEGKADSGLTIVTADVAERMKSQGRSDV